MSTSELEPLAVRSLLEAARETLVQEQQFTAEKAEAYLYELAQARKLFLADAAAQIMATERTTTTWRPGSLGSTDWGDSRRT